MAEQNVSPLALTPLQHREVALAGGLLRELPHHSKVCLRANPDDSALVTRINQLLVSECGANAELPLLPNTVVQSGSASIFWMGPDEWMVRGEADQLATTLLTRFAEGASPHAAVIDVSDYYTVLEFQSEHAMQVLARGCPLDMEQAFSTGQNCAQTRIGNAPVLLDTLDRNRWNIQVRWSFADYLFALLERSARSF